ncbi:MAG: hypothetical protein ACI9AR_000405 [Flavobacteriaceae bacterium]|jgi:hypothetical protein
MDFEIQLTDFYTRTMFCKTCFENNLPDQYTNFAVYGNTKKEYHWYQNTLQTYEKHRGLTPHMFRYFKKHEDGRYIIKTWCGIEGCGVETSIREDQVYIVFKKHNFQFLTLLEVQFLIFSKDDEYYLEPLFK